MALSRLWFGMVVVAVVILAGCASPEDVPADAELIYSGSGVNFAQLEPRAKTGTLYVYDDSVGKVVKVVDAEEPQSEFQVMNAANGHDIHVFQDKD